MTEDKGILIHNIYYMLSYAFQGLKQNNYKSISGEDFDNIYDLFAEIIIRGISCQLKQGLHKEYISINDSLNTLRGKVDVNGTIRNKISRQRNIVCEYDIFSENNLFNKILKTTSVALLKCPDISDGRKVQLRRLMLYFAEVDTVDLKSIKWMSLRFDRNSRNYQMLIYLCYFIAEGLLMTTEGGKYKMREFSDEHMHRLFEKFVLEYYRKHHSYLNPKSALIDWNIEKNVSSENMLPILKTDILLESPNGRTMVIDTKYYGKIWQEHYDKKTINSHNCNQIFTYIMNKDTNHTGKVDGMLLYAKTQEDVVPDGQVVYNDGNVIYFRTLDLNKKFDEIKSQLDGIVKLIS